jgi:hypothetical protein
LIALGRLLRRRQMPAKTHVVEEMKRQVALLREKIRYLQVMAMRPGQSSKDLERLRRLERAARTAVKRRASEIALVKGGEVPPNIKTSGLGRNEKRATLSRSSIVVIVERHPH